MAQQHGDRLSSVDASFLAQEGANTHMHVGAVLVLDGPPPAYEDLVGQIRTRLHLVPRYRQRLAVPPLDAGRPVWADDEHFDLHFHVRHTALPAPGSDVELRALAARIHSLALDRERPLWETWLVSGLANDSFALISKTHHALVDGVSGVDLVTVLFDFTPVPPALPNSGQPWVPAPTPTPAELVARGVRGAFELPLRAVARAATAATHPTEAIAATRAGLEGIGEVARAYLDSAPRTPLNVPIGPHRHLRLVPNELADFKRVKDAFGTTVNDVVLAVVAGALGTWLRQRGVATPGLDLRAMVPVSIRRDDQRDQLGNRLAAMRGPLPVGVLDPVERLALVKLGMDDLKGSKQALGVEVIAAAQRFAPPTLLAQAARLTFSTRLFNLLVTNVPGPQMPLYILGRSLRDLYPVAFLPTDHALAVAIMSYNGRMDFGLLGDYDAVPDIDVIADGVRDELAALVAAAA